MEAAVGWSPRGERVCARGTCPPAWQLSPQGHQLVPPHWGQGRGTLQALMGSQTRSGAADLGLHCTDSQKLAGCRPDTLRILVPAQGTQHTPWLAWHQTHVHSSH